MSDLALRQRAHTTQGDTCTSLAEKMPSSEAVFDRGVEVNMETLPSLKDVGDIRIALFNKLPNNKLSHNPYTPPDSLAGSPLMNPEVPLDNTTRSRESSPKTRSSRSSSVTMMATEATERIKLPSIADFDSEIAQMKQKEEQAEARPANSQPRLPSISTLSTTSTVPPASPGALQRRRVYQHRLSPRYPSSPRRPRSPVPPRHYTKPDCHYDANSNHYSRRPHLPQIMYADYLPPNGALSPPPDGEGRHINQKYTTEEGDFIIWAWHDKKFKWQRIKQEFARTFGTTPERTVQGLQAWYYRMNQRIPVWTHDGWLVFDNDDDLEPIYQSIKCRERDSRAKPLEPLGLAQRYPERAMTYHWVDRETKARARDWAIKRCMQYSERRDRRRRKEQRRLKL
jgi:hypothetical protein